MFSFLFPMEKNRSYSDVEWIAIHSHQFSIHSNKIRCQVKTGSEVKHAALFWFTKRGQNVRRKERDCKVETSYFLTIILIYRIGNGLGTSS